MRLIEHFFPNRLQTREAKSQFCEASMIQSIINNHRTEVRKWRIVNALRKVQLKFNWKRFHLPLNSDLQKGQTEALCKIWNTTVSKYSNRWLMESELYLTRLDLHAGINWQIVLTAVRKCSVSKQLRDSQIVYSSKFSTTTMTFRQPL